VTLLLSPDGRVVSHPLAAPPRFSRPAAPLRARTAYAAAHVIPLPWAENVPGAPAQLDWDATLGFRRYLWSWGLGVADAMDTAQRNMGLDPAATRELIARSAAEARAVGGALVVGVGTDHLDSPVAGLDEVIAAYLEQLGYVVEQGAGAVLMASRQLARVARSADDYRTVYDAVLSQVDGPVLLHWLGEQFDPALAGYWGSADVATASRTVLDVIAGNPGKVAGVKMSLLDPAAEVALRRALPPGTALLTGDDYHYVDLIAGDDGGHSDALLGAFAAIAPAASAALQALDRGDSAEYRRVLGPTEALSRHIFAAPTPYYKTGVAFLAWLNGHQPAFAMVGGLHAARSLPHLSEIVRLADAAGALEEPDLAAHRWSALLATHGLAPR